MNTLQRLIKEDLEDIENLYNSITDKDTYADCKAKLKVHIFYKKWRFKDLTKDTNKTTERKEK